MPHQVESDCLLSVCLGAMLRAGVRHGPSPMARQNILHHGKRGGESRIGARRAQGTDAKDNPWGEPWGRIYNGIEYKTRFRWAEQGAQASHPVIVCF